MDEKDTLTLQLSNIMNTMEQEELVDFRFKMVYSLKGVNGRFFFAELVQTFHDDSQKSIRDLTRIMDQRTINYHDLDEIAVKLKGGSSSIGAHLLAHACGALRHAIELRSKERCLGAVEAIKIEFMRLQDKLNNVIQLERRIAWLS